MQQMRGDEDVLRGPLGVCYCDFDELCRYLVALPLAKGISSFCWPSALSWQLRASVAL